jgi:hypothetical protein
MDSICHGGQELSSTCNYRVHSCNFASFGDASHNPSLQIDSAVFSGGNHSKSFGVSSAEPCLFNSVVGIHSFQNEQQTDFSPITFDSLDPCSFNSLDISPHVLPQSHRHTLSPITSPFMTVEGHPGLYYKVPQPSKVKEVVVVSSSVPAPPSDVVVVTPFNHVTVAAPSKLASDVVLAAPSNAAVAAPSKNQSDVVMAAPFNHVAVTTPSKKQLNVIVAAPFNVALAAPSKN